MTTLGLVLIGIALAVGLVGVVLPVLPGILLCWAAVLVWSLFERSGEGWTLLGAATAVAILSQVVKYVIPGQRLRQADVPWRTLAVGGLLAIVGFFAIPVIGLVIGFVGGVYVAERGRLGGHEAAWPSTKHAVKAVGLAILIELAAGLLITAGWLAAVIVS